MKRIYDRLLAMARNGFICLLLQLMVVSYGLAQGKTITGQVTSSEDGSALPGVNVVVNGTAIGTVTDSGGKYTLSIPADANTLSFSFIGFMKVEAAVDNKSVIDVALSPDIQSLDEVVVIGYGSIEKRQVTGAVGSVKANDIQQLAIQSVDQAIQGRVAGVYVSQNSGQPGGSFNINIRGIGSNRNNEPLYVIDGFPLDGAMGNSFNPSDIESIEILKDASAAAIYGARGANGVVLITTKRGLAQRPQIEFKTYYGVQEAWRLPEMLNAEEFATLHNEVFAGGTTPPNPAWSNPSSLGEGTDWLDAVFRSAPVQEHQLAVSGGNERLQTRLSLGYLNQQGIVISSGFERYSIRANLDYKVNDHIKVGASITPTFRLTDLVPNGEGGSMDVITSAQKMNPTLDIDDALPTDALYYPQAQMAHPVFLANTVDQRSEQLRTLANAFVEVNLLKNFTYRLSAGADLSWDKLYSKVPTITGQGGGIMATFPNNQITINYNDRLTWLVENTLTYDVTLGGKHNITALAGYSAQKASSMGVNAVGQDFLNDAVRSISAASVRDGGGSLQTGWAISSLIGRVSYDYDSKYLLSASIRRDGSSRFAEDYRYGTFPAVSAGWRISAENFMAGASSFLDDLKIRASWGQIGNDRIAAFQYLNSYSVGDTYGYTLGQNQTVYQGGILTRLGTRNLTWETSEQFNAGLDLALFNNALTFTADYFIKTTKDLLLDRPLPSTVGVSSTYINAGEVENKGWEFALGYQRQQGDFYYNVNANFTHITNEVIDLNQDIPAGEPYPSTFQVRRFLAGAETESKVGEPFGYFRGYIVDGVIQNTASVPEHLEGFRPGDFLYRDVNGDGSLNEADIVKIGNPFPDYTLGFNANVRYKGFDLNFFLQGVIGNDVLLATKRMTHRPGVANGWKEALNRWRGEGTSNDFPSISNTAYLNFETPSTFFVEDGSYYRCRNLEIGYSFRNLQRVGLSNMRLYLSGQNLFTITDYSGFDPEIGGSDPLSNGIDVGRYPAAKMYRLGVNLTF